MTAPVLDPARRAPAPRRTAPAGPPGASERPQLRVLRGEGVKQQQERRAQERDQRRLVRQVALAATALAALLVFGVVVFHVVLTQNQFRLDRLEEQATERQAEYDRLRLQVAQLESPDRVVADAQQRLGMVTPPKVTYLTPSVDEPGTGATVAPPPRAESAATDGTAWSTVKPHLGER